ncbi:[protein-PII] uridylyltransferase family protein [Mariniluteicoccus flavus]
MTTRSEQLALGAALRRPNGPGAAPHGSSAPRGTAARGAQSHRIVHWLGDLWRDAGGPDSGMALACTGSLARRELGPLSDLDLVVIHDRRTPAARVAEVAQQVWYPIWDSGLSLDHAVRTLEDCRTVGGDDLSVAGAMLDLSPIAGDGELVHATARRLADDWRAHARKRLPDLAANVAARHARFGELAQMLEPDLKEARGGLRDMGILRSLTASWLADRPHGPVDEAYATLLDVRDALQLTTKRPRNLLTMNDQDAVADLLGDADADALLQRVGGASRQVAAALDATLRRAGQSQRQRLPRRGPRRPQLEPLGAGIYAHDGEVVLGRGSGVAQRETAPDPMLALRAAVVAATQDIPLAPHTTTALAELPPLPEPWPEEARSLLVDLLGGTSVVATWNTLDLCGVVDRWLPEWADVRDRPQRNPLHRHTVDRHSLETVVEAHQLTGRVGRPDLLLVGALVHDIGKIGDGSDHSATGAKRVRAIARRWGFSHADARTLELLVAEHLTLMVLATTRDVADPATAARLARRVGDSAEVLDLLAALTEADSRAAGPRTWTSLRAGLVKELVAQTRAHVS